jgi:hypothetical protein
MTVALLMMMPPMNFRARGGGECALARFSMQFLVRGSVDHR